MPKVAISYRRSDSALAGRIFDHLTAHYGAKSVFMDIDNIPFGTDFRTHIRDTLVRSDVLIALIGANWLGIYPDGRIKMQEKTDPVRVEIETALENKVAIIPVLLDGAQMPKSTELPQELGNFSFLNAAEVTSGREFRNQMERLIGAIDLTISPSSPIQPLATKPDRPKGQAEQAKSAWRVDTLRYFFLPLVLLLVAHHVIVNALDLDSAYLRIACAVVPFAFGFTFFWVGAGSAGTAGAFAIALGLVAAAGMTVSQSLNSGDPIMPQTRYEWWDNINFAAIIALGFASGAVLARVFRAGFRWKVGRL